MHDWPKIKRYPTLHWLFASSLVGTVTDPSFLTLGSTRKMNSIPFSSFLFGPNNILFISFDFLSNYSSIRLRGTSQTMVPIC